MKTERLIAHFYSGRLTRGQRRTLYARFLNDAEARQRWPLDSRVIVPLALAATAAEGKSQLHRRPTVRTHHTAWRVAAGLALLLTTAATVQVMAHNTPHIYCNDPSAGDLDFDLMCHNVLSTPI